MDTKFNQLSSCLLKQGTPSLRDQNRRLKAGLVGLAALSICSMGACLKEHFDLNKTRAENRALAADVSQFKKEADALFFEKEDLKAYKNFVDSIEPFQPDLTETKNRNEKRAQKAKNIRGQRKWENAFKTLGVDAFDYLYLKARDI